MSFITRTTYFVKLCRQCLTATFKAYDRNILIIYELKKKIII